MSFFFQVAQELGETFNNIVGDVLLSAGIVAYLGPFTVEFRQVNAGKTLFKQRLFLRIFLCDNLYNVLFFCEGRDCITQSECTCFDRRTYFITSYIKNATKKL